MLQVALLAATSSGAAYVWMQVPAEPGGEPEPVATNVWFGQVAFQVSGEPGTHSIHATGSGPLFQLLQAPNNLILG